MRVKLVREIDHKYASTLSVMSGSHISSYKHSSDGNLIFKVMSIRLNMYRIGTNVTCPCVR